MISRALLSLLLVLASAGVASAGTLTTGYLFRGPTQGSIICLGTNVGAKNVKSVRVTLIGSDGAVVGSQMCINLEPGGSCQTAESTSSHCEVVFSGSKQSMRGSLLIVSSDGGTLAVEPAR